MKPRARKLSLMVFAAFIDGCKVSETFIPVNEQSGRLHFNGFSVQPPIGPDWHQRIAQDDPATVATFYKMSPVKQERSHTVVAMARLVKIGERSFQSPADFGAWLDDLFRESHRGDARHTFLASTHDVDTTYEGACVRFRQAQEDRGVRGQPGAVYLIEARGIRCLHPESSMYMVDVNVSERRLKDDPIWDVSAEIEPFLKGLQFQPITETSKDSRAEAASVRSKPSYCSMSIPQRAMLTPNFLIGLFVGALMEVGC